MSGIRPSVPAMKLRTILLVAFSALSSLRAKEQPNIVFILADDLGYGELGCYGQQKIKTPNIDRLASEGILFTHHYTGAPVCAPARCVLLTGRHLGHAEIRNNGDSKNGRKFPGQWPITAGAVTIAEVLQKAGYRTGGFGKWGLGPSDTSGSPIKQGFHRFYGYNCQRNAHSYYPPFLDDDEGIDTINPKPIPGHIRKGQGPVKADDYRDKVYAPDRILEEALKFLDDNKGKPFFLYLPFVEPHVAMQPPQEWLDRYPKDWDQEKGAYRGQNGYLPHPRPRAGYAAMISDLDEHVGAILDRLEKHGLTKNTLVVFTSDNGTTHPGRDAKFHIGGADAKFFNSTAGLRGWKGSVNEGGIRIPAIVRWPGKIKAGTSTDAPSYFPDWFPTICAAANTAAPNTLDGNNLLPNLTGSSFKRSKPMIWEFHGYGGQLAVIDFPWKAVRQKAKAKKPGPWQLYHLNKDPGENQDLAKTHPDIVLRLEAAFKNDRSPNPRAKLPLYDQ